MFEKGDIETKKRRVKKITATSVIKWVREDGWVGRGGVGGEFANKQIKQLSF
jgi:NADH:ubiquinone oxidoreductase subunit F (NADH-binding)